MSASAIDIHSSRPEWSRGGSVSQSDAKFLFDRVVEARVSTVVEIGTAAGVSTAILCFALSVAHDRGAIGPDFQVISYDAISTYYVDSSKPVGCAVEEMLPADLLDHIEFRNPAKALDLKDHHAPESLGLVFIDASHKHPWPALDLLAVLDLMRPGGEVVLHDINLPILAPEFPDWGAKHAFDGLDLEKRSDPGTTPPNIGSVVIPEDHRQVREQLLRIVHAHEWQTEIPEDVTSALLSQRR